MNTTESNYSAWLAKADSDVLNIRNNLSATDIPWDTVCFHAQQAAEKLLKAFLVYGGQLPPKTHDLVALLGRCAQIEPMLVDLEPVCQKLNYYAVGVRYPDDLYQVSESDGRDMIRAADRVRTAILSLLPTAP